jgi:hypothetical protein
VIRRGRHAVRCQQGSTYLELLLTVTLLAGAAAAYVAAFDGVEDQAAKAQTAFTLTSVQQAVRIHHVVTRAYPDDLDGLLIAPTMMIDATSVKEGGFYSGLPAELQGEDSREQTADGLLAFHRLSSSEVGALREAGITRLRMTRADRLDSPDRSSFHDALHDFDDPPNGIGLDVPLRPGLTVAMIGCMGLAQAPSTNCARIAALDPTMRHLVVAFGLGNHSSLIPQFLAEAPFSSLAPRDRYRRFLALYHLASDDGTRSGIPGNGRFEDGEVFHRARLLTVIDPTGLNRGEVATAVSLHPRQQ